MSNTNPSSWGAGRAMTGLAVALAFAACSDATGPVSELSPDQASLQAVVTAGQISVCKDGPEGTYSFEATVTEGPAGTFPLGNSFDIDAGACAVIFTTDASGPGSVSTLEITETNLPSGVEFEKVVVQSDFAEFEGTFSTNLAAAGANTYHGSVVTFYNVEDVDSNCVGLTPGYWKNWANHYTDEQFRALLDGTGFAAYSVEDATAILDSGGKDPVARLAKFMLANELTLALSGTDLPNPDGAWLDVDCVDPAGQITLGEALAGAWEIYNAGGEGYSRGEINMYKDILDQIANM